MLARLDCWMRKMSAGNVADVTGDARLAMEWVGDRSPKMMNAYLLRRDSRLEKAAVATGTRKGEEGDA